MYYSYMLYQAERPRTIREQREEDTRAGQLAAEFARLRHGLRHGLRRGIRRGPKRRSRHAWVARLTLAGSPGREPRDARGEPCPIFV
jgi:hypothetical protein